MFRSYLKRLPVLYMTPVRHGSGASFWNTVNQSTLWAGATGVSPTGKKQGRQKTRMRRVGLNRNRSVGFADAGLSGVRWPGLFRDRKFKQKIEKGDENVAVGQLADDGAITDETVDVAAIGQSRLLQAASLAHFSRTRVKILPLERGFSGSRLPGVLIGPPEPIFDYRFEGFDTVVLDSKMIQRMTGSKGRMRFSWTLTCVGNGQGLAGYSLGRGQSMVAALKRSRRLAAQRLQYFNLYENRTIWHPFYSRFNNTFIYACPMPEGHGIVAHRVIKKICERIGIKDIFVRALKSLEPMPLTYAFFKGLRRQETHQQLADRAQLHVLELDSSRDFLPKVIASPSVPVEYANMTTGDAVKQWMIEDVEPFDGFAMKPTVEQRRSHWEYPSPTVEDLTDLPAEFDDAVDGDFSLPAGIIQRTRQMIKDEPCFFNHIYLGDLAMFDSKPPEQLSKIRLLRKKQLHRRFRDQYHLNVRDLAVKESDPYSSLHQYPLINMPYSSKLPQRKLVPMRRSKRRNCRLYSSKQQRRKK